MTIAFRKYSANGNDFIMIDNRNGIMDPSNSEWIRQICQRRVSVGADGVILLENDNRLDFKMRYFNKDGFESGMCGNGGRAITLFAHRLLGLKKTQYHFQTMNSDYYSEILADNQVRIQMTELYDFNSINVSKFKNPSAIYMNTGVPHLVFPVKNLKEIDVENMGRTIRYDEIFPDGCNVNFIEMEDKNHISIRTYERGVEEETFACGTGITASAIACRYLFHSENHLFFNSLGGPLEVEFMDEKIYLKGTVYEIYQAILSI